MFSIVGSYADVGGGEPDTKDEVNDVLPTARKPNTAILRVHRRGSCRTIILVVQVYYYKVMKRQARRGPP